MHIKIIQDCKLRSETRHNTCLSAAPRWRMELPAPPTPLLFVFKVSALRLDVTV